MQSPKSDVTFKRISLPALVRFWNRPRRRTFSAGFQGFNARPFWLWHGQIIAGVFLQREIEGLLEGARSSSDAGGIEKTGHEGCGAAGGGNQLTRSRAQAAAPRH